MTIQKYSEQRSANIPSKSFYLPLSLVTTFALLILQNEMKAVTSFAKHHRRFDQRRIVSLTASNIHQQGRCVPLPSYPASSCNRVSRNSSTKLFSTSRKNGVNAGTDTGNYLNEGLVVSQADKDMIAETPLFKSASNLLDGLDTYIIKSEDGHPLSLYGINSYCVENEDESSNQPKRRPILMLHGRTWSSVPVYHLLGGANQSDTHHSRSLMKSLYEAGLQPYAMDFRGFGGTPCDATNSVIPNRSVLDVECALEYIAKKHGRSKNLDHHLPALMGWSQGALIAHLLAQKSPQMISKLVLYGSIYDPLVRYPRQPLFTNGTDASGDRMDVENTFNGAIEDFTVEGSIPPAAAIEFAEAALASDPRKARWNLLCQFNNCDPARVHVPTLVVAGDQDPYAPLRIQSELFTNLGRGADRTWSIIADADHAVHLLDSGKERFVNLVKSFVENGKKGEGSEFDV